MYCTGLGSVLFLFPCARVGVLEYEGRDASATGLSAVYCTGLGSLLFLFPCARVGAHYTGTLGNWEFLALAE